MSKFEKIALISCIFVHSQTWIKMINLTKEFRQLYQENTKESTNAAKLI